MARDLNEERDRSVGTNSDRPETSRDLDSRTTMEIAGELAADAYSIVAALGFLTLSYWVLFRNLPVELFTIGLIAMVLIAVNVIVAVRKQSA